MSKVNAVRSIIELHLEIKNKVRNKSGLKISREREKKKAKKKEKSQQRIIFVSRNTEGLNKNKNKIWP